MSSLSANDLIHLVGNNYSSGGGESYEQVLRCALDAMADELMVLYYAMPDDEDVEDCAADESKRIVYYMARRARFLAKGGAS